MVERATAVSTGRRLGAGRALLGLAGAVLLLAPGAGAQEAEHGAAADHGLAEEKAFRHAITLFGGLASHTENSDTGGAVGLSYAYALSHRWAIGAKFELASSSVERDFVALAGVAFEPFDRIELAVGLGPEWAERDEIEEGIERTVDETEVLLRLTFAYAIPLGGKKYLLPEMNADIAGSRVTYVYGLALTFGL